MKSLPEPLIGVCCLTLAAALFVVGLSAREVLRHLVQIAPVLLPLVFGLRGSGLVKWAAFPILGVWLAVAVMIGLFLGGYPSPISGDFPPLEVAMTVVIAIAAAIGLGLTLLVRSGLSLGAGVGVLAVSAALQIGALWVSFQPMFSHDHGLVID